GFLGAATQLAFFFRIFSGGAVALWLVLAFWVGLFVALARLCLRRLPAAWGWVVRPLILCGLGDFRSELYYLRFAWVSPGFAFGVAPALVPLRHLGTYGVGFVLMGIACGAAALWGRSRIQSLAVLGGGSAAICVWGLLAGMAPETPPVSSV